MDLSCFLPPSLGGLSPKEKSALQDLAWEHTVVDKIDTKKYVFILTSGRLILDDSIIIGPQQQLLGIKPFFKQVEVKYDTSHRHRILALPTETLAKFLLMHPQAMHSYLKMESNLGHVVLSDWTHIPKVWTVASDYPCLESIHLALAIANFKTRNNHASKAIYLELQSSGLSVYDLLDTKVSSPIVQTEDNDEIDLTDLIEKHTIHFNKDVDILNVHFLSMWQLSHQIWVSLFWGLQAKYSDIITHLGTTQLDFIFEDSSAIIGITSDNLRQLPMFHPEHNQTQWPTCLEIRLQRKASVQEKGVIQYPVSFATVKDSEDKRKQYLSLLNYDPDGLYWKWFHQKMKFLHENLEAIVVSDYGDNFVGFIAFMRAMWEQGDTNIDLQQNIKNKVFLFQGKSGILGMVAMCSKDLTNFFKACKKLVHYEITNLLKPIFPVDGFFSEQPVLKYLNNLFQNRVQDALPLGFLTTSDNTNSVQILRSGILKDNLARSIFILGMLQHESKTTSPNEKQRNLACSTHKDWVHILATCLRLNFKEVRFINFVQPQRTKKQENKQDAIARLLNNYHTTADYRQISGMVSEVVHIPYTTKEQSPLSLQEEEVYQQIQAFFSHTNNSSSSVSKQVSSASETETKQIEEHSKQL